MFYIIPNDFLGDWFLLLPLLDSSLRYYVSDEALLNCLVLLVQLSFCLAEISWESWSMISESVNCLIQINVLLVMSCKFIVYIRLFIYFEKFSVNIGINI